MDVLDKFVSGYNYSVHSSTGMAPSNVSDKDVLRIWNRLTKGQPHLQADFVYCHLIWPQLVGNTVARSLRTVLFLPADGHHVFHIVYYVPVNKTKFQPVALE
jgi:hypothetical protein